MKIVIFILCFLFCYDNLYSQILDKTYSGISTDSLLDNPNLIFKNDSIVELTSVPRHMSRQLRMTFLYRKDKDQIIIPITQLSQVDSSKLIAYNFKQFTNSCILKIENKCLVDENNKTIYVIESDFGKDNILTWIIDGKEYRQNSGTSDSYGLIKRKPRKNKALQKKMKDLKEHLDDYDLNIYRGLEAYKKFGFKYIPGVFELTKKK